MTTRSALVALVGVPNAGKSTLMNSLLGEDLAPVHHRVQMTRKNLLGIYTNGTVQILFTDTPGIHDAEKALNLQLKKQWESALNDADFVIVVLDPTQKLEATFWETLKKLIHGKKCLGVMNKADSPKDWVWSDKDLPEGLFDSVVQISALQRQGIPQLLKTCEDLAPLQPFFYDPELYTTATMREIAAQKIMETLMTELGEEIPYECAVVIETYKETTLRDEIHAVIVVNKESQKGMVIGAKGQKIKAIGQKSRAKLEKFLGKKVQLETFVKVDKDWIKNSTKIRDYVGLED